MHRSLGGWFGGLEGVEVVARVGMGMVMAAGVDIRQDEAFAKDGRSLVEERPRGSRSHHPRLTWT